MSVLHILVQFADSGGETPPLGIEAGPLEKSGPVTFKTINVPICLNREVFENSPLLELPKEGMIDDALVDNVEAEKLVHKFVIDEFTEYPSGNHLEGKDRDELLGLDSQLVLLLVSDNMGEMRQGLKPFIGVTDHDGEEF